MSLWVGTEVVKALSKVMEVLKVLKPLCTPRYLTPATGPRYSVTPPPLRPSLSRFSSRGWAYHAMNPLL